ncbi:MAG: YgjV family protein, partial [Clostridia bacterium]|nr:YgjV family protein [Clostridia bacterium]
MEILSQIVGYIGTATAVVGFQVKARKHLLLCQIFSNLLVALSFVLLGPDKLAGGSI